MSTHDGTQITAIAGVLAQHVASEGASTEEAKQAWRKALRYARATGTIGALTDVLQDEAPNSRMMGAMVDELRK